MAARRYILALDQGTSGSTALVVDADGAVRARGYAELTQHYPQPGWVEHDPEEIWTTMGEAARRALAAGRVTGAEIAAVGITNQRETAIVWERGSGRPIHRAIVWQCRRTAAACEGLKARGVEPLVRERTGLVLDAYFSGTKIGWLLDHVSDARSRAGRGELAFGTVDAWLLWKLTGGRVHATDCFVLLNTGPAPVASGHGLLTTIAWRIGGRTTYALEGSVFIAGAAVQWLRDGLGIIATAADSEALARSVA